MFELNDKRALVTGAASGIGKAIAAAFARQGAQVWIGDVDDEKGAAAAAEIGEAATFINLDVTCTDSIDNAVASVAAGGGRLDIWVNNAGVGHVGTVLETEVTDWDRIMAVNAKGMFLCSRAVVKHMTAQEPQGGVIINMASIASLIGVEDRFAYCATKGAALQMTRCLALDHIDAGIRCNCICPGRVHTPFVDEYLAKNYPDNTDEMFEKLSKYQPIGRMGRPDEIAAMAVYLASDEAAFITGAAFTIDGGVTMG